jgi:hypothetical protein
MAAIQLNEVEDVVAFDAQDGITLNFVSTAPGRLH